MLEKKMGSLRAKVRDGELVLAGRGKEDIKDGMSLSWVWVDLVGMRTAITRTKIRKGLPMMNGIQVFRV
jgi:hypothetical protein